MGNTIFKAERSKAENLLLIRKGALLGRPLVGPAEVGLMLTYACNYRCLFCSLPVEPGGVKEAMPIEVAERLIPDLARAKTRQVSFTGGGDPLCYSAIDRLILDVRSKGMACSVCTNGALLTGERVAAWSQAGVHLSVSLNASSKNVYQLLHPGSTASDFSRILSNLETFAQRSAEDDVAGSFLSLNFVVCKENYDQLQDAGRLATELGAKQIQFRLIQPRSAHKDLMLDADQLECARAHVRELEVNLRGDEKPTLQVAQALSEESSTTQDFPCLEGFVAAYIDSDGVVFPCCMRSVDISNHFMGNVHDESFFSIWNGDRYQAFRRQARALDINGSALEENSCRYCPKARHFSYLADERAPGNFAALFEREQKQARTSGEQNNSESSILGRKTCRAEFLADQVPSHGAPKERFEVDVHVTNRGDRAWPGLSSDQEHPVGLGYHLLDRKGRMVAFDNNPRPYLPHDLLPGATFKFRLPIRLPAKHGQYQIELDLVQEKVAWFSQRECKTLRIPIQIG